MEWGESREEKQGGRTWHKLLILAEKRHCDWRFSVTAGCFKYFLLAINISLVTQLLLNLEYLVTAHCRE